MKTTVNSNISSSSSSAGVSTASVVMAVVNASLCSRRWISQMENTLEKLHSLVMQTSGGLSHVPAPLSQASSATVDNLRRINTLCLDLSTELTRLCCDR